MRIKQKLYQHRRDFTAVYECQHCGSTKESYGYDDDHFHVNVIPNMPCDDCGKIGGVQTSKPDVPRGIVL